MRFLTSLLVTILSATATATTSSVAAQSANTSTSTSTGTGIYTLYNTVTWPSSSHASVDQALGYNGVFYLSDRAVGTGYLDIVDLSLKGGQGVVGRVTNFTGAFVSGGKVDTSRSGPNGNVLLEDRSEIWVGDANSTVRIVNILTRTVVASIYAGGIYRVDEFGYDNNTGVVISTSDAETPPFVTFYNATSRTVITRVNITEATNGIEQPVYDSYNQVFYVSVPEATQYPGGAIAVFSPLNYTMLRLVPTPNCNAHGIAVLAQDRLAIGCSIDQATNFNLSESYIINPSQNGALIATIPGCSGNDQIAYSSNQNAIFFAAYQRINITTGTALPTMYIVDATSYQVKQTIATDSFGKDVGADTLSNTFAFASNKGILVYKAN